MSEDKVLEIKKRVSDNFIHISRIPKKAKIRFQELSKEEFEGDYGMTVKWLLDFRDGLLTTPNQVLIEQVQILSQRVDELTPQEDGIEIEKTKKEIKGLSGKTISTRS